MAITGNRFASNMDKQQKVGSINRRATSKASSHGASRARFEALIEQECQKLGLDAGLGKAVAMAESGMRQGARSSAGAIGIMQLMPGTAQEMGIDPRNAEENIRGGLTYLKRMLDEFDGKAELALAAYNAGPGNVRKHNGIPPFAETQRYVQKVLGLAGDVGIVPTKEAITKIEPTDAVSDELTLDQAQDLALRLLAQARYQAISLLGDMGNDEDNGESLI